MGKVNFAPRDSKIIKDNPGMNPYQLLDMGLSKPAFERLMSQPTTDVDPEADETLDHEAESPGDQEADNDEKDGLSSAADEGLPPLDDPDSEGSKEEEKPVLTPKLTKIAAPAQAKSTTPRNPKLLPGQVMVQTPNGIRNAMGREFAQKLIKQDPRYRII